MIQLSTLPALNAALNATSAAFLLAGFLCIRAKRVSIHALCMVSAFVVSGIFLVSYLTYHARVGVVHFLGKGWIRPVYFTLLLTHTSLAIAIVPLAARSRNAGMVVSCTAAPRVAPLGAKTCAVMPLWPARV